MRASEENDKWPQNTRLLAFHASLYLTPDHPQGTSERSWIRTFCSRNLRTSSDFLRTSERSDPRTFRSQNVMFPERSDVLIQNFPGTSEPHQLSRNLNVPIHFSRNLNLPGTSEPHQLSRNVRRFPIGRPTNRSRGFHHRPTEPSCTGSGKRRTRIVGSTPEPDGKESPDPGTESIPDPPPRYRGGGAVLPIV